MTQKKTSQKSGKMSSATKVTVALAGVAAAAVAGYYFFYGAKEGAARRKKVTAWSKKLKAEVIAEAGALNATNKKVIGAIVKRVSKAYREVKTIKRQDLEAAMKELEQNWEAVKEEAEKAFKRRVARAKNTTKKVTKKN